MEKNSSTKKTYLDLIRVVAVFLVLYSHFANAASWITSEATVFSDKYVLPINNGATHRAYILDTILARFNTAAASIGVILFFLLAGYLTAMTREKYTPGGFLLRRIVRLYPALALSVILCGIISAFMGVRHSVFTYMANALLLYPLMGPGATIGVLWSLAVELLFYCIILHCAKIEFRNVLIMDLIILLFTVSQAVTQSGSYVLMYYLKFIPIILFGGMMYSFHRTAGPRRYVEVVVIAILTYLVLYVSITFTYKDAIAYKSPASYILALGIWAFFFMLDKFKVKCVLTTNKFINLLVNTSYLVYLLQLNVGFSTMYFLRELGMPPYPNILCGVAAVLLCSAILHYSCEKPLQRLLLRKFRI